MDKKETSAPSWPQVIATPQAPPAIGPYSQALRVGPWLYCSGQLPLHPQEGALVGADLASQTEQALRNLQSVVEAAGGHLAQVVKTTCFLKDLSQFAAFNRVYAKFFPAPAPARSAVEVQELPKGALVEIEAIAYLG